MKPIAIANIVVGATLALAASAVFAGEITLFERPDFQGRRLTTRGTMPNLDRTDFNDRAESIAVRDGVWEVCSDAHFNGQCVRLQPGEYRNLRGSLDRSISSVREVTQAAYAPPAPVYAPPAPVYAGPGGGGGGQPRAILYSGQGMSGRAFEIDRNVVRNLDGTGFNDRAASLSVLGGYWIFCSDANFEGDCRTFGPGDYPNLPFDVDRKISSGRRIADRYPYEGRPTWSR
jgi:hypothetical protein